MKTISLIMLCAVCLAGCKKPVTEPVPQPKTGDQTVAVSSAPAVSTSPTVSQSFLNMPGNYVKTTVGHIGEAKAAKALFENTAKQEAASTDLNNTGGN